VTVAELSRVLYELDVPVQIYRLDGSQFELAHVLGRDGSRWVVFLSERGGQSDRISFADEHQACIHLLGRICGELIERGQLLVRDQLALVAPEKPPDDRSLGPQGRGLPPPWCEPGCDGTKKPWLARS